MNQKDPKGVCWPARIKQGMISSLSPSQIAFMRSIFLILMSLALPVFAENTLDDKLLDGNQQHWLSPSNKPVKLGDLGLGKVPPGNNKPVRVVAWSKIPGEVAQMGYNGSRLFCATVNGKVWEYTAEGKRLLPEFLDIRPTFPQFSLQGDVTGHGMRGFAFHPDFQHNRLLYTIHLELDAREHATLGELSSPMQYVLTEWQMERDSNAVHAHRVVLRVGYLASAHGASQLAFNPAAHPGDSDYGLLYIGFGDGGGDCAMSDRCVDQFHYGQNFTTILSGIIRINPLQHGAAAYSIPADNPFLSAQDPANKIPDELFAKGFRNPSTMMFDQFTGKLFVGDISQNSIEEINLIESGKNYGYGLREGTWIYTDRTDADKSLRYVPMGDGRDVAARQVTYQGKDEQGKPVVYKNLDRISDGFTYPVAQFSHHENGSLAAVVTGTFYHGTHAPAMKGLFLFGNLSQDNIFYVEANALENTNRPAAVFELNLADADGKPAKLADIVMGNNHHAETTEPDPSQRRTNIRFGQDSAGDLYIISKHNNTIYRLLSD